MELKLTEDQKDRLWNLKMDIKKNVGYILRENELAQLCMDVGIKEMEINIKHLG